MVNFSLLSRRVKPTEPVPEVAAESVPETPPVTQSGKIPVLTGSEPNNFFF